MEHPFLDVQQIKDKLTLEEVQDKIRQLVDRLNFAYRTGNQPLINQLQMVYEVYTRAQREMVTEIFSSEGKDQDGKIDIS